MTEPEEDTEAGRSGENGHTTTTDEGKGLSRDEHRVGTNANVNHRLDDDQEWNGYHQQSLEGVVCLLRYSITTPKEDEVEQHHYGSANHAQLLEDDAIDVVGVGLGKMVSQLTFANETTDDIAVGDGHMGIHHLHVVVVDLLFPQRYATAVEDSLFPDIGTTEQSDVGMVRTACLFLALVENVQTKE